MPKLDNVANLNLIKMDMQIKSLYYNPFSLKKKITIPSKITLFFDKITKNYIEKFITKLSGELFLSGFL